MANVVAFSDWALANIWLERDTILDKTESNCFVSPTSIFWIAWFNWFKPEDNLLIWSFCSDEVSNLLESCWIPSLNCSTPIRSVADWLDNWLAPVARFPTPFV